MKIALDARTLTGRFTGDRTYWKSLIGALLEQDRENEYRLLTRLPIPDEDKPTAPNVTFTTVNANNDRLWTLFTLPKLLRESAADLLHVQYTAPLRCPCPFVTTVHDISFRLHPAWFPRKDRLLLNLTVPSTMRRAASVITDSESSRRDILRHYALDPKKLHAVSLGAPGWMKPEISGSTQESVAAFAKERYGIEPPYFLAVGVLQPRKNLPFLIRAFAEAKQRGLRSCLVLTGKTGWGEEQNQLTRILAAAGVAQTALKFTGYVADNDLPGLYRGAEAFLYPSLYEGFGLPPLEAMECETPVLASSAPAMPEVCGKAALLLSPTDPGAWANAMLTIEADLPLRTRLIAAGREHAAEFTWPKTAEATLQIYREIVRGARD